MKLVVVSFLFSAYVNAVCVPDMSQFDEKITNIINLGQNAISKLKINNSSKCNNIGLSLHFICTEGDDRAIGANLQFDKDGMIGPLDLVYMSQWEINLGRMPHEPQKTKRLDVSKTNFHYSVEYSPLAAKKKVLSWKLTDRSIEYTLEQKKLFGGYKVIEKVSCNF